ncbi:MAG: hypothetical protein ABIQ99_02765 [Thermoflexales bacterium]
MKTTIDIPEALYKRAKIRAVEKRTTLRDVVLGALERDIEAIRPASLGGESQAPYWSRRKLQPKYRALLARGALKGGGDSTSAVSDERDAR